MLFVWFWAYKKICPFAQQPEEEKEKKEERKLVRIVNEKSYYNF